MAYVDCCPDISKPHRTGWAKVPFHRTRAYADQSIFRRLVKHSQNFTWPERLVMTKLLNLWLRHRRRGWFEAPVSWMAETLDVTERTISKQFSHFRAAGILIPLMGGNGRGHKVRYAVDLWRLLQTYGQNLWVFAGGQAVNPVTGEVIEKGEYTRDYSKNSISSVAVTLPGRCGLADLQAIMNRIASLKRAWFRREGHDQCFSEPEKAQPPASSYRKRRLGGAVPLIFRETGRESAKAGGQSLPLGWPSIFSAWIGTMMAQPDTADSTMGQRLRAMARGLVRPPVEAGRTGKISERDLYIMGVRL